MRIAEFWLVDIHICMNWQTITFDWNQARAFLVTAEEGSLSAAARALGLTQPTLSRQVAALEQTLGVTLFERVSKSLILTKPGSNWLIMCAPWATRPAGYPLRHPANHSKSKDWSPFPRRI